MVRCTLKQLPSMADEKHLTPPTLTVIGQVVGLFDGQQVEYPARLRSETPRESEAVCG